MYEVLAEFAQTGGLLLFVLAFILVLIYTFRPANRQKFEDARRMPLDEEEGERG